MTSRVTFIVLLPAGHEAPPYECIGRPNPSCECIGGLDPSTVDRDPVRHLDTIFGIAESYGVELDIHLHEPGMLGAFAVELIAERTRALGMQGRVTISHTFCLGMIDEVYLGQLIDLLLENRITIMSLGSGRGEFPPVRSLNQTNLPVR